MRHRFLSALLCLALGTASAEAQFMGDTDHDPVYEMARNKVGLLRYCKQKGLLDAKVADEAIEGAEGGVSAVAAFRETAISKREGDLAEKNGEAGLWGTTRRPMEKMAESFVRTPEDLCQQWADEAIATRNRRAPANRP